MSVSPPSGNTIVLAVVAIVCLIVAAFTGLAITGDEAGRTPLITTLVGLLAPTLVGLMALLRADTSAKKVEQLDAKVTNGLNTAQVANAVALGKQGESFNAPDSPESRAQVEELYQRLRVILGKETYEP